MIESVNFAHWLTVHGKPGIMPSEIKTLKDIMYRATDADLISILYHGRDELALKALKELKERFEDEMNSLEQATRDRAMNHSGAYDASNWD